MTLVAYGLNICFRSGDYCDNENP